ncbi:MULTISPECIES: C40 family peptidase [Photorhabdus]|uniref:C40 family peptidase n=1 Tax=Photorhabdus TaxID=29487 RepID=UPI000DCF344E|nr:MULTISPECIES: NlpC/P60 family protein [Photorhabdus]MCT8341460.1 NlpC/P60 family protein [Photorhabdus kleinii]RAX04236.1 endopeptidase [Photorhabdus sp. S9-53]RAX04569.1 endopeptidase [Photorhabdus sp. S10-54]RAX06187.1 endopeptidase [Photorhabdus sp. S8-52]
MIIRIKELLLLFSLLLIGCSSHAPRTPAPVLKTALSDPIMVIAQLKEQLNQWRGTPYHYGGMDRRGVDCSGFVYRTFSDRFDIQLPRTTGGQIKLGTRIDKSDLMPGDLVFFKTASGEHGLHVGIYDANNQFIHASTHKGVTRSSMNNVYWKKAFWQARRI